MIRQGVVLPRISSIPRLVQLSEALTATTQPSHDSRSTVASAEWSAPGRAGGRITSLGCPSEQRGSSNVCLPRTKYGVPLPRCLRHARSPIHGRHAPLTPQVSRTRPLCHLSGELWALRFNIETYHDCFVCHTPFWLRGCIMAGCPSLVAVDIGVPTPTRR